VGSWDNCGQPCFVACGCALHTWHCQHWGLGLARERLPEKSVGELGDQWLTLMLGSNSKAFLGLCDRSFEYLWGFRGYGPPISSRTSMDKHFWRPSRHTVDFGRPGHYSRHHSKPKRCWWPKCDALFLDHMVQIWDPTLGLITDLWTPQLTFPAAALLQARALIFVYLFFPITLYNH